MGSDHVLSFEVEGIPTSNEVQHGAEPWTRGSDVGSSRAMKPKLVAALEKQYRQHSRWSFRLHADNLVALVKERSELGQAPSYSTVCRRMKANGWIPKKRLPKHATPGQRLAYTRLEQREVRSYEREHVHAMWHSDFHRGYRKVVDDQGRWRTPFMVCFLDDRSRLCCHAQWYLAESAENFVHGLSQALAKRGLPRELMTDNGSAMLAGESRGGLARLGIVHNTTLPYSPYHSPYQNGKQESFWNQVDGRLLAMVEDVEPLTLDFLNRATQAWVEGEYNRKPHEELGCAPLDRVLSEPDASRPAADSRSLRLAFTLERPQSRLMDFYRELGNIFDVNLSPANHYGGFKALRQRWKEHVTTTMMRPVLLIDEAQETPTDCLNELRLLGSVRFDSACLLTTVLSGDNRLKERLKSLDLLPLQSRIHARLDMDVLDKDDLRAYLDHAMTEAGAPNLMSAPLLAALAEHSKGNMRRLNHVASQLVWAAAERRVSIRASPPNR